jgi:transcriptional regulator with GAF, ATPase, and Fis domain
LHAWHLKCTARGLDDAKLGGQHYDCAAGDSPGGERVTAVRRPALPAGERISALLEALIPGNSASIILLRQQVLDFSAHVSARTVLLRGPIGAGKSTVARAIGFLKRIAPLTDDEVETHVKHLKYDGPGRVSEKLMPWYVELSLTGLVESLADSQLFGYRKGAFTGAVENKAGVFEQAATGRGMTGEAGSKITGGVVFLDEIGDLPLSLQAKLLPVLSGGVFYRVGQEGIKASEPFEGVTITASWRNLETLVRPDLLSRISAYVIEVPGIDARLEDLRLIVENVQGSIVDDYKRRIEKLCNADPAVDRAYWRRRLESIRLIDETAMGVLVDADWARLGNLRGLTTAVERIVIGGEQPRYVLGSLPTISDGKNDDPPDARTLLMRLLSRSPDNTGLAQHVRAVELEDRARLRDLLGQDDHARGALARALGIPDDRLAVQALQLNRTRTLARRRHRT